MSKRVNSNNFIHFLIDIKRSFCGNPSNFGLEINEDEYSDNSDLYYGIFNFDNFANSLFTGMSLLSITGWTPINDIVIFFDKIFKKNYNI